MVWNGMQATGFESSQPIPVFFIPIARHPPPATRHPPPLPVPAIMERARAARGLLTSLPEAHRGEECVFRERLCCWRVR
jgi:hypothetical protein